MTIEMLLASKKATLFLDADHCDADLSDFGVVDLFCKQSKETKVKRTLFFHRHLFLLIRSLWNLTLHVTRRLDLGVTFEKANCITEIF